jgi:hypothetical protein
MIAWLRHFLGWMVSACRSRGDLVLENLALRRQLLALHAQRPHHRLTALHKLFWVALRTFWSGWRKPLVLVTPRTVVNWHRAGFRLYWSWIARVRQVEGRKRVGKEIRTLIFRMVAENPTWLRPDEAVGVDCRKGGIDQTVRPIARSLRGWSGEATDRSKPSDNVPTLARVALEPRGDGVSASMRRRGARLGAKVRIHKCS